MESCGTASRDFILVTCFCARATSAICCVLKAVNMLNCGVNGDKWREVSTSRKTETKLPSVSHYPPRHVPVDHNRRQVFITPWQEVTGESHNYCCHLLYKLSNFLGWAHGCFFFSLLALINGPSHPKKREAGSENRSKVRWRFLDWILREHVWKFSIILIGNTTTSTVQTFLHKNKTKACFCEQSTVSYCLGPLQILKRYYAHFLP